MSKEALTRDYTKFYTLPETAELMVDMADIGPTMSILEPSAGSGIIVKAIRNRFDDVFIHAVEIQPMVTAEKLMLSGADIVTCGDFLKLSLMNDRFDRVIANPPFGNETNLGAHFMKMYQALVPDGILVGIFPGDFIIDEQFNGEILERVALENWGTNKDGTVTPIQILKFKKIS